MAKEQRADNLAPDVLDKVLLLVITGLPTDTVIATAAAKFGLDPEQAQAAVKMAQRRITLAADFNRVEEIGRAVSRLNAIYAACCVTDPPTALSAQRELNKLLDLYGRGVGKPPADTATANTASNAELEAIRSHLLPLELAPETYPLQEHARLAAEAIRSHR